MKPTASDTSTPVFTTAELCDRHSDQDHFQVAEALFLHYGAKSSFCGQITTLKVFEDSLTIRSVLKEKAANRILVVDGGGSHRCALIDHALASLAVENGWQGMVLYGCVRDSDRLATLPIGIRALHAHPLKCHGKDPGERDQSVNFAGVQFKKDHFLYADSDGIIVSAALLS